MHARPQSLGLAVLLVLAGCATASQSRGEHVSVQHFEDLDGFAVHAFGGPSTTADEIARRAMLEGCKVTRDRGYSYYGVNNLESSSDVQTVQTSRESTLYLINSSGRATGAITSPDEYRRYRYGKAMLVATMLSPGSISLLGGSMQIVDANTCLVHSRPN